MTTMALDKSELRRFSAPRTSNAQMLRESALSACRLAHQVRTYWSDFDDNIKSDLRSLGYYLTEPPSGFVESVKSFIGRIYLATALMRGEHEALGEYFIAVEDLRRAILGAVENESAEYQAILADTIRETLSGGKTTPMTATELRKWLNDVSDREIGAL